jgi:hypothetical protein
MAVRTAVVIHRNPDREVAARPSAMSIAHLPWKNTGRPATPAREHAFVADLRFVATDSGRPHRRMDTTAVLNALRGGLTLDQLLEIVPGLQPDRLLGAYAALEAKRAASERAWSAIVEDPTPDVLAQHAPAASRLLPAPVASLVEIAAASAGGLGDAVDVAARAVRAVQTRIRRLEWELDHPSGTEPSPSLDELRFDHIRCAYADGSYLPTRVGALMPARAAALLSECRRSDHHDRSR